MKGGENVARQTAYQKHWKRLSNQIRRMERRGYIFEPDFREELKAKSARSLAQIKTKYLYKRARYLDVETGEVISAEARRKAERSEASRKGAATKRRKKRDEERTYYPSSDDMIMYNLEELLRRLNVPVPEQGITVAGKKTWKPPEATNAAQQGKARLARLVAEQMADEEQRQALADRVQQHGEELSNLIDVIEYSRYKEQINVSVAKVVEILSPSGVDFAAMQDYEADEGWYAEYSYSSSIDPTQYDMYEDEE